MLFDTPQWEEEEEGGGAAAPQLSALTWAAVKSESKAGGKKKKRKSKSSREEVSVALTDNEFLNKKKGDRKKKKKSKSTEVEPVNLSDSGNLEARSEITKKVKKLKKQKSKVFNTENVASTGLSKTAKKVSNLLVHNLPASSAYKLDRLVNTPTATKALLDESEEDCDNEKDPVVENLKKTAQDMGKKFGRSLSNSKVGGHLLTLGEKFSSEEAFLRFIGLPGKGKRGNKRNRDEDDQEKTIEVKEDATNGADNDAFKADIDHAPIPPPRKKRKEGGMDITKLRSVLAEENTLPQKQIPIDSDKKLKKTLAEEAKMKLSASRFRYLNEQLYSQPGNASAKLFKSDQTLFSSYHHGYQLQAAQWPLDPLNVIISDCLRLDDKAVIADFGCGEARLARSVPNKVHSLDLVAANESVVACDMANTPLEENSVDVVVFCLALMGTNTRDFLFEASRVLKVEGMLKIAELESRFQGESCSVDTFIDSVGKFGFKNSWKDLKKDFFYFLDFQKVRDVKKKKKLPDIELKPCLYKKR